MKIRIHRLERWVNKMYAKLFDCIWMKCPICGEEFGEHEIGDRQYMSVIGAEGEKLLVCPKEDCLKEAISRKIRDYYTQKYPK